MQYIIFFNLVINLTINNASLRYFNCRDIDQDQMLCHFFLANKLIPFNKLSLIAILEIFKAFLV